MAILVDCGACGRQFRVKDQFKGTRLKCPHCQKDMLVAGPHVRGHDAFVSYSSKDKQVADAVCAALESKHLRCWIAPRDIPAGASWSAAIIEGIEDSRVLVLVFSANANASDQVLREVERAVAKKVPVVPLRIDRAGMSKAFEYFLASCHWLDATDGPLERHLTQLSTTVRTMLLDRAPDEPGRRPFAAEAAAATVPAAARPDRPTEGPPARSRRTTFATLLALLVTAGGIVGGLYVASHPDGFASRGRPTTGPAPATRPATTFAHTASTRGAAAGGRGWLSGARSGRGTAAGGPKAWDAVAWTDLFDGKTLNGWDPSAKANWTFENGILVGPGGVSRLSSVRQDFGDFVFRADVMIADGGSSAVMFHTGGARKQLSGYKVNINATAPEAAKTGSLLRDDGGESEGWRPLAVVDRPPAPAGQWFTLEVITRGPRIRVLVNGAEVVDYDDPDDHLRRGGLVLQQAHAGSYVKFRKVQVKELPPAG